jgi:hypothetical protein
MKFSDLEFKPHPYVKMGDDSIHAVQLFPNGYGVSVVRFPGSYGYQEGLYEVAVIQGTEDDYELCYDTPIADDIMGHRDERAVEIIMEEVQSL